MIIFIDSFSNSITYIRNETKKSQEFFYSKTFEYSLSLLSNKIKAIKESINEELVKEIGKEGNQLILSDDIVAYDTSTLPVLSKKKLDDIFTTSFRMCFSHHDRYHLNYFEFGRDEKNVTYFYEIAKRDVVNKITSAFKSSGININVINTFSSLFVSNDKSFDYPNASLIIGEYNSELIITKGNNVFGVNIINYGTKTLLNGEYYLNSAFSLNNEESLAFAGFIKENIATREEVNDFNILKTPVDNVITYTAPKEMRLLKEEQLIPYRIKNNFRKFYARIIDVIDFYSKAPWFFPLKEVNVFAPMEAISMLTEVGAEDKRISFIDNNNDIIKLVKKGITHLPLFDKRFVKERRKIDWAKLLTMEIGKKKDSH